jgi:Ran-binding protein 3
MRRESPQPSSDRASASDPLSSDPLNNSDGESGEKPVREKLRDTTIAGQSKGKHDAAEAHTVDSDESAAAAESGSDRGRLPRKRSRDDLESTADNQDAEDGRRHVRKRSREAIPGSDIHVPTNTGEEAMEDASSDVPNGLANGTKEPRSHTPETSSDPMEDDERGLTSPKNKRTRDQVLRDEEASTNFAEPLPLGTAAVRKEDHTLGSDKTDSDDERKVKRTRESCSPHASGANEEENGSGTAKVPTELLLIRCPANIHSDTTF